jgi:hypothetical protein
VNASRTLVADALVRHLGADAAAITVSGHGDRLTLRAASTTWQVEVAGPAPGRPFTLLEFEDDLTPVDDPGPRPTVAVVGDGRSFLLSETAGLAGLIETVARETEPGLIADLVLRFADDRVEHIVTGVELTAAGASALRAAGVTAGPPTAATEEEDGPWRLRFVAARLPDPARSWRTGSAHGAAPGGVEGGVGGGVGGPAEGGVDFREWIVTIRATGGVDWQARPVALQVPDAVDVTALFARNRG